MLIMKAVKQYTLRYEYHPDVLEKRGPYRVQHLEWIKQFLREGKCLSVGTTNPPLPSSSIQDDNKSITAVSVPTGALFVFKD